MIGIRVTASMSPGRLEQMVRNLVNQIKNNRKAFRKIAKTVIIPSVKHAFASRTAQDGDSWEPRQDGSNRKLLDDSGALKRSMTRMGAGADGVRIYGKKFLKIGTNLAYALPLQWGYGSLSFSALKERKSRRQIRRTRSKGLRSAISSRRFVAWSTAMRESAAQVMVEHLQAEAELAAAKAQRGGK